MAKNISPSEIRSLANRLYSILRDNDSHRNTVERFDELTKMLFLKLQSEEREPVASIDTKIRTVQILQNDFAIHISLLQNATQPYLTTLKS